MRLGYGVGVLVRGMLARRSWGRLVAFVWMASVAVLAAALGVTPAMASASASSFESAGVRAELSHQLQQPGPVMVSQGGEGGTGAVSPPSGVLVPGLSTAFSDTWSAPHRPLVTRIFKVPVNYKGSDGAWHAIDNTLTASPLGGYENAGNSFSLRIPESLSAGVSLSDQGHSLAFTLVGASTALPTVEGGTATYSGVLPSTDLSYVSQSSGVEEVATLKDTQAPSELTYQLSGSTGLTPRQQPDGSVAMVDQQGATWFTIPVPVAFPRAAGASTGRALPMSVSASGSGWLLSVDTGEAWVREALASGSVVVDPTVNLETYEKCTLNAEAPTTSQCSGNFLEGYDATHQEHHALAYYPTSSIPVGSIVVHAKLGLYLESHSTSTAKAVGVYRVTRGWSTTATWNTYDGTHNWTTAGGDYANPSENSDAVVNPSVGTANGWVYWYPTKMVQEWVNGPNAPANEGYENDGIMIKDETDNKTSNLLQIASTVKEHDSYVEVFYEPRGQGYQPQYTILSTPLTDHSTMGVNVASGDLIIKATDLHMAGIAGLDFTSTRTSNSLNRVPSQYGTWVDSNFNQNDVYVWPDGTVALEGPTGGWLPFIPQANKAYITPPGIKATMCTTGSPSPPCPKTLPSGTKYQLTYNQSGDYVNYNEGGIGKGVHDRFGNAITAEYPSKERTVYTDTHGHKIEELINSNGDITEIKDLSGSRSTKYSSGKVEGALFLESYTDAAGKKTSYEPIDSGQIRNIKGPNGNHTKFNYINSQVSEIIRINPPNGESGSKTTFTYYEVGKAPGKYCTSSQKGTLVRDPDWTKPEKEEGGEKFTLASHETLYCANVLDEVEKTFDAESHETSATYDKYANVTSTTAAAREAGAKPGVTSHVYDPTGQDLQCDVQGTTSVVTECPTKALEKGYSTSQKYEDTTFAFQPTTTTSPRLNATNLCYYGGTYACTGKGKEGETGEGGALRRETQPEEKEKKPTTIYSYEKDGNVSSSTDFNEHTTSNEYDTSGNLKTVIPPSGSGLGKQTITVDGDGRPHIIVQCLAESSCTSSNTTTLTYDPLDRITEAVYTGPGATKTIKYTYNADGGLEKLVDPTGTTTYTLDPLGRITEEALPGSVSNAYSYDEASNLLSLTDAGGTTHYFYNGLNELESMYEPGGNCGKEPSKCTTTVHDNDGSLTKTTYPSGASMRYKLDATTGRILVAEADGTKGETLLSHTYSYFTPINDSPLIFKDTFSGPGGVTAESDYSYDALDRLTEGLNKSATASYQSCYLYHYDAVGNITREESTPTSETCTANEIFMSYNAGNELECRMKTAEACSKLNATEISGYKYDGAGNQTAITGYNDPASTSFAFNNLSQLEGLTPPGKAEEKLKYLGSGQSKLTGLGTTTLQNSTPGTTKQTIEGNASYYARTPDGTLINERLPGATSYNPVYDAQGDVIGLLNSTGALVQTVRYGPYGENTNTSGTLAYSTTNDPFLFQGGYHTSGGNAGAGNVPNNLYHYGERYYDPTTGRWTQPDPASSTTDFMFVGDDPVNAVDPSGEGIIGDIEEAAEAGAKVFEDTRVGKVLGDLITLKCLFKAKAHSTGRNKSKIIIEAPAEQIKYIKETFKCFTG